MLEDYTKSCFEAAVSGKRRIKHDIYTNGDGPVILLMHELPGLTPKTEKLANVLIKNEFTVVMPHLFGKLGKSNTVKNTAILCIGKEISCFLGRRQSSPITIWLRALCQKLRLEHNVDGIGVIGMCLTGNFALSLVADNSVLGAVSSQPSLPFGGQRQLHMSKAEIEASKERLRIIGYMNAYRFKEDSICRAAKFESIRKAFNTNDENLVNTHEVRGNNHSVLTENMFDENGDLTNSQIKEVIEYFNNRLNKGGSRLMS